MIKNYAIAGLLLFICFGTLQAQKDFFLVTQPLGQGDVLLGGSIIASQSNADNVNSTNRQFRATVSPEAQFFLSDKLVFGMALPLGFSRNLSDNNQVGASQRSVNSQVNLFPSLKFVEPLGDRVYLFVKGFLDLGWGTTRSEIQPLNQVNMQSQFLAGAGLTGGASFLVNDYFLVEGSIVGINYYWRNINARGGGPINVGSGFWLNPSRPTISLSYRIPAIK